MLQKSIRSDTLKIVNTFLRTNEFDTWLKELKDHVGKARIIARSFQPKQEILVMSNLLAKAFQKCVSITVPNIGFIFADAEKQFICCFAVVINHRKRKTLKRQSVSHANGWKNEKTAKKI